MMGTKDHKKSRIEPEGEKDIKERMMSIASIFMKKTEERMKKETTVSVRTLIMVSLSEKLFGVISVWR